MVQDNSAHSKVNDAFDWIDDISRQIIDISCQIIETLVPMVQVKENQSDSMSTSQPDYHSMPRTYSVQRHLGAFVEGFEYSWPELLHNAGLSHHIYDADLHLSPRDYISLWRAIEEKEPEAARVYAFIQASAANCSNPVSRTFLASQTLGEGLRRIQEIKPLEAPLELHLKFDETHARISVTCVDRAVELPEIFQFTQLLWLKTFLELQAPDEVLRLEVNTQSKLPSSYLALSPDGILFGDQISGVISIDALAKPIQKAAPQDQALDEASQFIQRTEWAIRSILASRRSSIDDVARALNTSKRNLQRRLRAENMTYSELLSQTRMRLVDEFLEEGELSIQEIAYLLDYSEPSALYRAYRKHRGQPLSYQKHKKSVVKSRGNP